MARTQSRSECRICPPVIRVGVTSRTSMSDGDGDGRVGSASGGVPPSVSTTSSVAASRRSWNDASIEKITSPSCTARTWRAENDPPSRSRSTWKMTGRSVWPGRRK